jgi:putative transposase
VFPKEILNDMRIIFASVCRDFEPDRVELDGEDDHVHLLANSPPKVSVSSLMYILKCVSSRLIRQKRYPCTCKKWGAIRFGPRPTLPKGRGGAPFEVVREYIEHQETPH